MLQQGQEQLVRSPAPKRPAEDCFASPRPNPEQHADLQQDLEELQQAPGQGRIKKGKTAAGSGGT
jgi:hypothetical protein